jgi:hypothetical protein
VPAIANIRAYWHFAGTMKRLDNKKLPPATEEIFKEVWSVWNLLPADCAADYRVSLLKCPKRDFPSFHKWLSGQRKRLARESIPHPEAVSDKFLKAFKHPFDDDKYHLALRHAEWWHNFARENYPAVATRKSERVKRWLHFQDGRAATRPCRLGNVPIIIGKWYQSSNLPMFTRRNASLSAEYCPLKSPKNRRIVHSIKRQL